MPIREDQWKEGPGEVSRTNRPMTAIGIIANKPTIIASKKFDIRDMESDNTAPRIIVQGQGENLKSGPTINLLVIDIIF